jgi:hypothetical protein
VKRSFGSLISLLVGNAIGIQGRDIENIDESSVNGAYLLEK